MTLNLSDLPGILQGLRQCLENSLTELATADAPVPKKVEVRPGAAFAPYFSTTEDECKCGVGWVRLDSIALAGDADAQPRNASGALCGPVQWTVSVEIGVQRCPTLGDAHTVPTGAESLRDTMTQLNDERAMRRALRCCFSGKVQDVTPGQYTPIGPEGLCYGGTWTATLTLDDCADCPPGD